MNKFATFVLAVAQPATVNWAKKRERTEGIKKKTGYRSKRGKLQLSFLSMKKEKAGRSTYKKFMNGSRGECITGRQLVLPILSCNAPICLHRYRIKAASVRSYRPQKSGYNHVRAKTALIAARTVILWQATDPYMYLGIPF
jgi:hypothetical protein